MTDTFPSKSMSTMLPPVPPSSASPLKDTLLVAMPAVRGDTFARSVVYLCAHSAEGAMGIVVNQTVPDVRFSDLLAQLKLPASEMRFEPIVHFGGPVEQGRGFVLHSTDFVRGDTVKLNSSVGITGTVDILRAISEGAGPRRSLFALGYAGWGPGQLDAEIRNNFWLNVPVDDELLFDADLNGKWERALRKIGASPAALSPMAGNA